MESLYNVISDIRIFIYGGLNRLPLIIAGTLLIIGLITANYAILFFLLGYLVGVPIANELFNFLVGSLIPALKTSRVTDICRLVIPYAQKLNNVKTSDEFGIGMTTGWAMVSFFLGYMLHNAWRLYERQTLEIDINVKESSEQTKKVSEKILTRKSQAILSLITICIFSISIGIWRYKTGCENCLFMLISAGGFGAAGWFWYLLLSQIGDDRLSDLFGIANRLLTPGAISNKPIACIPQPV